MTKFENLRLEARALACVRGERLVFEELSFTLHVGEVLLLTGPNGAGKSSLLRQIAGLVDIAGGTLTLVGGDPERAIGEQAHYVGHLDALKPAMSVRATLAFWSAYFGGDNVVADVLTLAGLEAQAELPIVYLSAGQRRRLALARLHLASRPLWLLDEPGVALDAHSFARLIAQMQAHLRVGGMIVAATHTEFGLAQAHKLDLGAAVLEVIS